MADLSKHSGSLTHALESFISTMGKLSMSEIRTEFLRILVDDNVKISDATRSKWIDAINKCKTREQQMRAISNCYLAGSGLSVNA